MKRLITIQIEIETSESWLNDRHGFFLLDSFTNPIKKKIDEFLRCDLNGLACRIITAKDDPKQ